MGIQNIGKLLALATKHAWRNRWRSMLIAFCVAFGNFVLLYQLSQGHGQEHAFMANMINSLSGHLQLYQTNGNAGGSLFEAKLQDQAPLERLSDIKTLLARDSRVESMTERVRFGSMMSHNEENWASFIVGADASQELAVCDGVKLAEGRFIRSSENEIVISSSIARERKLKLGDSVTLLAGTTRRSFNAMEFKIVGLTASTGISKFYSGMAYIPIERARKLVGLRADAAMELVVRLRQTSQTAAVAAEMAAALQRSGVAHVGIRTWHDMAGIFLGILKVSRGFQIAMAVFLGAVILILIFSTFSIRMLERGQEMATLRAIGFTQVELYVVFLAEAVMVTLFAALIGLGGGAVLCTWLGVVGIPAFNEALAYVFAGDRLFPILHPADVAVLLVGSCLIALAAVLAPLRRALGRDFTLLLNRN